MRSYMMENEYTDFLEHFRYIITTGTPGINAVVDISQWNESVDFRLAKEYGRLGIIHKATQGAKYADPKYVERKKAAEKGGLL